MSELENSQDNLIAFKPREDMGGATPMFARTPWDQRSKCKHDTGTLLLDIYEASVTCSACSHPVEAIRCLQILAEKEAYRARRDNAATYHRIAADEAAEKQALKTRKAAYETLYRFGVTPEIYAEEYRRRTQFADLAARQDYSKTLPFGS